MFSKQFSTFCCMMKSSPWLLETLVNVVITLEKYIEDNNFHVSLFYSKTSFRHRWTSFDDTRTVDFAKRLFHLRKMHLKFFSNFLLVFFYRAKFYILLEILRAKEQRMVQIDEFSRKRESGSMKHVMSKNLPLDRANWTSLSTIEIFHAAS